MANNLTLGLATCLDSLAHTHFKITFDSIAICSGLDRVNKSGLCVRTSEYSYCYKTVTASSELYSRGCFYVSQSGIVQDNDRFYFTIFIDRSIKIDGLVTSP